MPTIYITEITGSGQVVGPDITNQFLFSGFNSGDNITVDATGTPIYVNIDVVDSGESVSVSGFSSGDSINVTVQEAVFVSDGGPWTTRLYYSGDGKLIQKSYNNLDMHFSYNVDESLNQIVHPDYTKTMLYNVSGVLTGFNVT
jgi:hypothetical protein